MTDQLSLRVVPKADLTNDEFEFIVALCDRAFEEDTRPFFATFPNSTYVLGTVNGVLVSHGLWITRWLRVGDGSLLRTAYVEMVATDAAYRERGYAADIMRRITREIQEFDIAALSPFSDAYYARLGWELWRGPLFERKAKALIPSPEDEEVMILRLPNTPELDLNAPLSIEWREGEVW